MEDIQTIIGLKFKCHICYCRFDQLEWIPDSVRFSNQYFFCHATKEHRQAAGIFNQHGFTDAYAGTWGTNKSSQISILIKDDGSFVDRFGESKTREIRTGTHKQLHGVQLVWDPEHMVLLNIRVRKTKKGKGGVVERTIWEVEEAPAWLQIDKKHVLVQYSGCTSEPAAAHGNSKTKSPQKRASAGAWVDVKAKVNKRKRCSKASTETEEEEEEEEDE